VAGGWGAVVGGGAFRVFGASGIVVVSVVDGAAGGVVVGGTGAVLVSGVGVALRPPRAEVADGLTSGRVPTVAAVLPARSVSAPGS
jgi:hypothetical protein